LKEWILKADSKAERVQIAASYNGFAKLPASNNNGFKQQRLQITMPSNNNGFKSGFKIRFKGRFRGRKTDSPNGFIDRLHTTASDIGVKNGFKRTDQKL